MKDFETTSLDMHSTDYRGDCITDALAKTVGVTVVVAVLGLLHNHSPSSLAQREADRNRPTSSLTPDRVAAMAVDNTLRAGGQLTYFNGDYYVGEDCIRRPIIAPEGSELYWGYISWDDKGLYIDMNPQPVQGDDKVKIAADLATVEVEMTGESRPLVEAALTDRASGIGLLNEC